MYQIKVTRLYQNNKLIAKLTGTEAEALDYLIKHPNEKFSAETLAEKIGSDSPNYIRNRMPDLIKKYNLPVETVLRQGWRWIENEIEAKK